MLSEFVSLLVLSPWDKQQNVSHKHKKCQKWDFNDLMIKIIWFFWHVLWGQTSPECVYSLIMLCIFCCHSEVLQSWFHVRKSFWFLSMECLCLSFPCVCMIVLHTDDQLMVLEDMSHSFSVSKTLYWLACEEGSLWTHLTDWFLASVSDELGCLFTSGAYYLSLSDLDLSSEAVVVTVFLKSLRM